jgi:signal transduction histidine kinase
MLNQNRDALLSLLEAYYRSHGDWEGVGSEAPSKGMGMGRGYGMGADGGFMLVDASRRVVVPSAGYSQGEELSAGELARGVSVEVDGQIVGVLIAGRGGFGMLTSAGAEFLMRVNRALIIATFGATAVALLLGLLLARALTRPLREITAATRSVAGGDLGQKVPVRSSDELGELAVSFNQMSSALAQAQDSRQQMTADIAHELRTPLSVLRGHAEALRDGVIPATPENFTIIHDEIVRLNRLVEDLRTVSLAEAGELSLLRQPVSPGRLLERAAAAHTSRAAQRNIELRAQIEPGLPLVDIDSDRMSQVLNNLLDNALRHTPDGGSVTLIAKGTPDIVQMGVKDTGPGIAPEELPRIFDRFYRTDKARRRDQGGSGLGLAIAKSIVQAHGGRIWAESQSGEGVTFFIELPTGTPRDR